MSKPMKEDMIRLDARTGDLLLDYHTAAIVAQSCEINRGKASFAVARILRPWVRAVDHMPERAQQEQTVAVAGSHTEFVRDNLERFGALALSAADILADQGYAPEIPTAIDRYLSYARDAAAIVGRLDEILALQTPAVSPSPTV